MSPKGFPYTFFNDRREKLIKYNNMFTYNFIWYDKCGC